MENPAPTKLRRIGLRKRRQSCETTVPKVIREAAWEHVAAMIGGRNSWAQRADSYEMAAAGHPSQQGVLLSDALTGNKQVS